MKRSNNVQKYPGGGLGADGRDGNAWCDDRGWYQKMRMRLWLGCLVSQNAMSMGVKDLVTATVPRPPAPLDPKSHPAQRRRQRLNLETINQPINQSTSQPVNQPIIQPINQSTKQSTNQPVNQIINQSNNQPINQSTKQSTNQSSMRSVTSRLKPLRRIIPRKLSTPLRRAGKMAHATPPGAKNYISSTLDRTLSRKSDFHPSTT